MSSEEAGWLKDGDESPPDEGELALAVPSAEFDDGQGLRSTIAELGSVLLR